MSHELAAQSSSLLVLLKSMNMIMSRRVDGCAARSWALVGARGYLEKVIPRSTLRTRRLRPAYLVLEGRQPSRRRSRHGVDTELFPIPQPQFFDDALMAMHPSKTLFALLCEICSRALMHMRKGNRSGKTPYKCWP